MLRENLKKNKTKIGNIPPKINNKKTKKKTVNNTLVDAKRFLHLQANQRKLIYSLTIETSHFKNN